MPLDMRGPAQYERDVHYRRYLSEREDRVVVICVQDFDYHDYDEARFVDLASFPDEASAEFTPLRPEDVVEQCRDLPGDGAAFGQALRLIAAIKRQPYPAALV